MKIRMFAVLLTVVLFGCSGNLNLESLRAGRGGALVDFNIAQFDAAPATKALPILDRTTATSGTGKYDFSVEEVHFRESSFLVNGTQAPSVKLIAKNRGYAPVSVTITYDRDLSENMTWDADKSHTSVVPPQSEKGSCAL